MATTQTKYRTYGIAEGDSKLAVWNDAPGDAAGIVAGEAGRGRSMEYAMQMGHSGEVLAGIPSNGQGAWDNVSLTVNAGYMGTNHRMLVIVNGVSYTITPGTATEVPRIVKEILDNALDPHGNKIPYS